MGNRGSSSQSQTGSEMESGRKFSSSNVDHPEHLADMKDLLQEKETLKKGVSTLSTSIDQVFQNVGQEDYSTEKDIEEGLQAMTRSNQLHIEHLTRQLDRHARIVIQGREANETVIAAVIDLVTIVNAYMTMLIRNIRKLKRLLSEQENFKKNEKINLYQHWRRNQKCGHKEEPIYDVINDHQDVDAMLVQLTETEAHREELESDIVSVLVCWRDYQALAHVAEDSVDQVEADVLAAADSVAHGLTQLNSNRRAYEQPGPHS